MAEGHRQRMRERFYKEGIDNFEPHEALEMLLYFVLPRRDTNALAHSLIDRFGSFHSVLEADREDLKKFGLTETTAALLNMTPAFGNYYLQSRANGTPVLNTPTAMGNYAVSKIGERTIEVFGIISLTTQMRCINFEIIETGTVSNTTVSPRKAAEAALRCGATTVILTHNHPGGSLIPSNDDIKLTEVLCKMFKSIGISVLDHIIVANGRFSSMQERGLM
ncbi:MAG: DNA repair protein RadC [Clostridia bacterium]|nr:DNA repair protein RadC [Clostridia bacterium]